MIRALLASSLLVAAGDIAAQGPGGRRFTDVSAASNLKIAGKTGVGGTNPHAVAVEDFDGDGKLDVILLTFGAPHVYLFRNRGDLRFEDVTKGSGLENFQGEGTGIAVADFDRDGLLDVYATSVRGGASRLYRGRNGGRFEDASQRAGVLVKRPARSCAWSDVDGDGHVDLYVCCPGGANLLFRNKGDGTFADVAKEAGVELADRHSLGCCFGDVDGDGRDDLFVTNYQSQPSSLFLNRTAKGGPSRFQDVSEKAGVARRASSVGCVFADAFRTGRLDLYVTTDSWLSGANYTEAQLLAMKHTVEPNLLHRGDGKGGFTAAADIAPSQLKTLGHDVVVEDLDHDGWLDIHVGVDAESGNQWATSKGGNRLWTRQGGDHWTEVAKAWGIAHEANCVCVPAADLDDDGDLDLLLVNFYTQPVLLRNDTNDQNWLRVRAAGKRGDLRGIGALVSIAPQGQDAPRFLRHIHSGAGYCRSSPLEAHVGLGKTPAAAYRVEVRFPGGAVRVVENVKGGRRLVVEE